MTNDRSTTGFFGQQVQQKGYIRYMYHANISSLNKASNATQIPNFLDRTLPDTPTFHPSQPHVVATAAAAATALVVSRHHETCALCSLIRISKRERAGGGGGMTI
jgi:hypothetical protein